MDWKKCCFATALGVMSASILVTDFVIPTPASAELLCMKRRQKVRGNRVNLNRAIQVTSESSCPGSRVELFDTDNYLAADTPLNDEVIGFVSVEADGTVNNFGGNGTDSVSVIRTSAGVYNATFTGTFTGLAETDSTENRELLTLLATAHSNDFEVSNAFVTSASSTEIIVRFFTWRSDVDITADGAGAFLSVLIGEAPEA